MLGRGGGKCSAGILEQSMGAGNRVGLGTGSRTGPPGYIGWRNRLILIDSWAPPSQESM